MTEENTTKPKTADITQSVVFPPRPEALAIISTEVGSDDPDIDLIFRALKADPGLYAAILQVVNSPAFGVANKVTAVEQAVGLLGLDKVAAITRSVAIRATLSEPKGLPNFWDTAAEIAELCAMFTSRLTGEEATDAYTMGMFHNCGIPVLMQAFDDYPTVIRQIFEDSSRPLHWLEKTLYGFTHYQISGRLTQKWFLPAPISQAILLQPAVEKALSHQLKLDISESALTLLSVLTLAKHASPAHQRLWHIPSDTPPSDAVLARLELSLDDYLDLKNSCLDELND